MVDNPSEVVRTSAAVVVDSQQHHSHSVAPMVENPSEVMQSIAAEVSSQQRQHSHYSTEMGSISKKEKLLMCLSADVVNTVAFFGCDEDDDPVLFERKMSDLRCDVALELGQLAGNGDREITTKLEYHLKYGNPQLRQAVVEALAPVAKNGDQHTISMLIECLLDKSRYVRRASVKALAVAPKGDEHTITVLSDYVKHCGVEQVRMAALEALSNLVEKGDQRAMTIFIGRLQEKSFRMRKAAVEALVKVAERGSHQAITVFSASLEDTHPNVRAAAQVALTQFAGG